MNTSTPLHSLFPRLWKEGAWWVWTLWLFCVAVIPHHHHAHEDVCIQMHTRHAAAECDNCCVARFLTCRLARTVREAVQPVFLLLLFASFGYMRRLRVFLPAEGPQWAAPQEIYVPDDVYSKFFCRRGPPSGI